VTKTVETRLGFGFYAAVEQMDSCQIARVLQRVTQRENAPGAAVVVLRGQVTAVPAAPAADWWQRDRIVADQRIGLQTLPKRCEIAQRLDGGARLAHSLGRTIELAQRIGEAAGHGEDAARLVLQNDHRSLYHPPPAPGGPWRCLAPAVRHP